MNPDALGDAMGLTDSDSSAKVESGRLPSVVLFLESSEKASATGTPSPSLRVSRAIVSRRCFVTDFSTSNSISNSGSNVSSKFGDAGIGARKKGELVVMFSREGENSPSTDGGGLRLIR